MKSNPVLVREMAKTLYEHGIDPMNNIKVIKTLIGVGYRAKEIEDHYDDIVSMALIRKTNDELDRRSG